MRLPVRILVIISLFFINTHIFAETYKILFIGNSLTFYNKQPEMFSLLATNESYDVHVEDITIGGASLLFHNVGR